MSVGRTLYAVVDAHGFRPLVIGRLGEGVVVASETCALDLVGAPMVRELEPGEFVRIEDGVITELPRLKRPAGQPLRLRAGLLRPARQPDLRRVGGPGPPRAGPRSWPASTPPRAPTSSSASRTAPTRWPSATREVSGIKLEHGLIRNHYVGRTFIHPTQALRVAKVKIKFNPVRGRHRGPLGGRGGRQPGPRHHQQGAGADDPRRRRPRGPPPARLAADHRALPLRHRHADPRGADRGHPLDRGDPPLPRRGLAGLPLARGHARRRRRPLASATPASRASIRPPIPDDIVQLRHAAPSAAERAHDRRPTASRWSTSSARAAPTAPPR